MKYTIIDSDKGTPFISQVYDTEAEAQARLDALMQKFGGRYKLAIEQVKDEA